MSSITSVNSNISNISDSKTAPKNRQKTQNDNKQREIINASKKFEAYFISKMIESMRKTVPKDGLFKGGFGKDVYFSMLDNALADEMTEAGGIGISKVLYDQLGIKNNNVYDSEVAPSTLASNAVAMAKEGIGEQKEHPAAPIHCKWLGSRFGPRFSVRRHAWKFHKGIDLNAPMGTPVKATLSGVVKVASEVQGYGNAVYIDHGNGLVTRYGHASKLLVKPGEHVKQGQTIALVGQTGRADGPHLHFEVRINGTAIDPEPWLGEEVMNETAPNYIHLKKH